MKVLKLSIIALILSAIQLFAIDGFPGTNLEFDGVNDYVDLGEPADLKLADFTISCWFKRTGTGVTTATGAGGIEAEPLITKGRGEADGNNRDMNYFLGIRPIDNVLIADFEDYDTGGNHPVAGITAINNDEWYHAAITYDGTWRLYLNGNLEIEQFDGTTPRHDSIQDNAIGSALNSNGTPEGYFKGLIDEVSIWSSVRTVEEIRETMYSPLTGVETGLVGYWQFNDGSSTVLSDAVGGNSGILTNMDEVDWVNSTIPFGGGFSDSNILNGVGFYTFTNTDFRITLNNAVPDDSVTVTKLNTSPNVLPTGVDEMLDDQYWIVDEFGTGMANFDLVFSNITGIDSLYISNPNYIKLFGRKSNSDLSWSLLDSASHIDVFGGSNEVIFEYQNSLGQFIIAKELFPDVDIATDSLDFGTVMVGDSLSINLNIANVGNDTLHVSNISVDHSDIFVNSASCSIGPNADHNITLTFVPTSDITLDNTLTITSNDPDEPNLEVILLGNGVVEFLIVSTNPADDASDVMLDSDLQIVFNRNVIAGNGNIIIHKTLDDSIVEIIFASSTLITDSAITINPIQDLELGTDYYVLIDSTSFMKVDSLCFSGVYDKQVWNFRSKSRFTDISTGLLDIYASSVAWGDYDNDGDLDILLSGNDPVYLGGRFISRVYRNNSGTFTDVEAGLIGVEFGSVAWGDYDNDGDLDILLTGDTRGLDILLTGSLYSIIYRNDGNDTFTDIGAGLDSVLNSSVAWGDYDNDGDLDILLTGWGGSTYSIIYNNDSGIFTDINAGLTEVEASSVAWGDYDNDGDLDILLTGYYSDGSGNYISKIYRNDGNEVFIDINAGLIEVAGSSVAWGDYDNDGDLDILLTGILINNDFISKIYRNDLGIFTDINAGLKGVYGGSAWGDYDNDGDLDILLTGEDENSDPFTKIYCNNSLVANTIPNSPVNLSSVVNGSEITFSWDKATDNETPQDGLSYNLYVGTVSNKDSVNSSMSDISTGYRKVACLGNVNQNSTWTIKGLEGGTYYWSVQAVDHTFAGSQFSAEQIFTGLGSPANVVTAINGNNLEVSWDAVDGVSFYKVYASDDPYGIFVLKDVLMGETWTIPYTERSEFYYIKAVNGGKMPDVKKVVETPIHRVSK